MNYKELLAEVRALSGFVESDVDLLLKTYFQVLKNEWADPTSSPIKVRGFGRFSRTGTGRISFKKYKGELKHET